MNQTLSSPRAGRRRPLPRRGLLALVPCVLVAGCATKGDVRGLQEEIRELYSQQQLLLGQLRTAQTDQEVRLIELTLDLRDERGDIARQLAGITDQLLTVQELSGLSQQQLAGLRDQLERDRAQMRFAPTDGLLPGTVPAAGDQAGELYTAALTQLQRGSLGAARLGFQQVVDQFGSHELAPEARYYLAEILEREGSPEDAIEAFLEIQEFHPTADRVPDALYRIGLIHLELGNPDDAEQFFERVVNTWPDSDASELARSELRDL